MYLELRATGRDALAGAYELERIERGIDDPTKGRDALKKLVEKLKELHLDNEEAFKEHVFASLAFWEYLKKRDGKVMWEQKKNATISKVFHATHKEFLNIERLANCEQGDIAQAKALCLWLHLESLSKRHFHHRMVFAA